MAISKLMPILMLLGIGVHSKDALTQRLAMVLDLQYSIVTQIDLRTILRQVQADAVGEQNYQIRDFREFVRKSLEKNAERDVSVDAWGTPYQHEIALGKIKIASAGPDKNFGTGDDLEVSGLLVD